MLMIVRTMYKSFNPTLVRLRPLWWWGGARVMTVFQSHAGSIEADDIPKRPHRYPLSFNPTLVRLRHLAKQFLDRFHPLFQSHAGSIEAHHAPARERLQKGFQSHAGSIEAL